MKIGKNINYSNQSILLAAKLGYYRIIGYVDGGMQNTENVLLFRKSRNEWLAVLQAGERIGRDGIREQDAIKYAKCGRDFQNHTLESAIEFVAVIADTIFEVKHPQI